MAGRVPIHQGDVVFVPIDDIPKEASKAKRADKILALGEVTGHHHRFAEQSAVQVYGDRQATQYVDVSTPSTIFHEEHLPLEIPKGAWKVTIARELDLQNEVRRVVD